MLVAGSEANLDMTVLLLECLDVLNLSFVAWCDLRPWRRIIVLLPANLFGMLNGPGGRKTIDGNLLDGTAWLGAMAGAHWIGETHMYIHSIKINA